MSRLLTAREAGDVLGEHEQTVRKHTRQGHYPFARNIGTDRTPRWRYDARALERWLESRTAPVHHSPAAPPAAARAAAALPPRDSAA